jgi:hypothetical protein
MGYPVPQGSVGSNPTPRTTTIQHFNSIIQDKHNIKETDSL